ncbi:[Skp1-protein]-hydroxyproline N-acetylglucosaminyltransferase [Phytophthora ramorum]|uniref:[Skp1-protein]-hydroxyproline N-acetylglucosaminyltransferase n=1 Tax=Phytophthora ramorum TaxID=164328 RepID=UPI0030B41F19|nr:[Skp1-protein]-hydroxyproline N-acetylglucosaminyltransferase [Phytophthora ramorum]
MEPKTLLNTLSPQLQALVEASLGTKLPPPTATTAPQPKQQSPRSHSAANEAKIRAKPSIPSSLGLNPSELFALQHPESPGFVVKEGFLGRLNALAVRDALTELAQSEAFHEAKVGAGENLRNDRAVRGDRIHWIQTPRNLNALKEGEKNVSPAILHLRRQVEALVYGLKQVSPELDLRNVVSTQFAIFPGDGARFVKHFDTYSNAQRDERGGMFKDGLVRLVTCVYYLNDQWETEDGGQLRVHLKGAQLLPESNWDIPPTLDTLVMFRSLDVEHEVLPTYRERKAVTIWYYGKPPELSPSHVKLAGSADVSVPRPLPSVTGNQISHTQHATIFVAIPSYRDSECRHTVDDLLAQATFPDRISIGICLQVDAEDDTHAYLKTKYSTSKVRVRCVDYQMAAGPCVARAQAQKVWQGEEYYLQIDSHMRFRPGWDCFLINELGKCSSAKSILTTYPLGYTLPNKVSAECRPTLLCASSFDEDSLLRQTSKILAKKTTKPLSSLFWAAGFAFSSSKVIAEVPYDETLRFLFFGEESSMAARLWTSGWDFFTPSETVVYHLWTRAYRPVFQELENEETKTCRAASAQFVKQLLQADEACDGPGNASSVGKHPLGTARSFESYQKHVGVDFSTRSIEWRSEWGNLDPIQFDLKAHAGKTLTPV